MIPKPSIISIANQKGGVGKTTTAINLATALASVDNRVLIMDLDAQGNASTGLGVPKKERELSTYDLLIGKARLKDVVKETNIPSLFIAPASIDLSSVDVDLFSEKRRVVKLRDLFESEKFDYDFVLIDCPPSLNLLTVNSMVASNSVLVPLQAEFFALEGLSQLLLTVRDIRTKINSKLKIHGIVLTMFDKRNNLSEQIEDDVRENLGELVYDTVIPRNVRISEAPSYSMPALIYDHKCSGAVAYQKLAAEFLKREDHFERRKN
ncbi:ParA family protein [Paracoccaceae bacterium]|nr:ParA family protein [Paracoccaceae bacterium]